MATTATDLTTALTWSRRNQFFLVVLDVPDGRISTTTDRPETITRANQKQTIPNPIRNGPLIQPFWLVGRSVAYVGSVRVGPQIHPPATVPKLLILFVVLFEKGKVQEKRSLFRRFSSFLSAI